MAEIETTELPESLVDAAIETMDRKLHLVGFIRYSQNFVYEVSDGSENFILRITSNQHRSRTALSAELHWIDLLKDHGVSACGGITRGDRGKIYSVETPTDTLHCVLFEKARGLPISERELNEDLYYLHGELTGMLHTLARVTPPDLVNHRMDWSSSRVLTSDIEHFVPPEIRPSILQIRDELMRKVQELPRDEDSFGMIHLDLHYNNFFIDNGTIHLFDFDNCTQGHFAADIAKALWSSVFTYHRNSQFNGIHPYYENPAVDLILEEVWRPFFAGYASQHGISDFWLESIPLFFRLTHLKEFVHHYRMGTPYRNEELKKIFEYEYSMIQRGVIPVSFDFTRGKALRRTAGS